MVVCIVSLTVAAALLVVLLCSTYCWRVRFVRRLIRNKGAPPDTYTERTDVLSDINYGSVFSDGVLDIYTANEKPAPQPILLWVHGGGYVGGDKTCIRPWAHVLAAELHIAVASVNYALAPEQHYPVPLLQISEALRFLQRNSERFCLDTEKIFLAGDSAGAQMVSQYAALVCSPRLQEQTDIRPPITREQLRGIVLCCGFYNMDTVMRARFPAMQTFLWAYTECKHIRRFARKDEMSAVKHIDETYCDVFLTCGNSDPFLGQAEEMARALRAKGVPCSLCISDKCGHEYQYHIGRAEADVALYKAMEFIRCGMRDNSECGIRNSE